MHQNSSSLQKPPVSPRAFWDIDFNALDFDRFSNFVIIRVFEQGTMPDIEAITAYYGQEQTFRVLTNAPVLMPIAVERAKLLFNLSYKDFACLKSESPLRNYSQYQKS